MKLDPKIVSDLRAIYRAFGHTLPAQPTAGTHPPINHLVDFALSEETKDFQVMERLAELGQRTPLRTLMLLRALHWIRAAELAAVAGPPRRPSPPQRIDDDEIPF